jgi:acyl carrier protein
MDNIATLKQEIKRLMVENLMLQVSIDEIGDDQPLFGPGSLGLDSVDALQLVVALDKTYGLKIANPDIARQILQSVTSIATAVTSHNNPRPVNGHSAPAKSDGLDRDQSIRTGS